MFKAFSYFDKDASGFITREELEDALQVGTTCTNCLCVRQVTLFWVDISQLYARCWWQCLTSGVRR